MSSILKCTVIYIRFTESMVISSHSPGTLVRRLVPPPHSQEQSDHPDLQFRISCDFQLRSRKTQRYLRYVLLATLAEGPVPLPLWVVGQSPQRQLTILHSLTLTGNSTKARTNHHEMIGLHQSNLVATLTKQNCLQEIFKPRSFVPEQFCATAISKMPATLASSQLLQRTFTFQKWIPLTAQYHLQQNCLEGHGT